MDSIYLIVILVTFLISEVRGAMLKQMDRINIEMEEVLYKSENEKSPLQCAHKCRRIDKEGAVVFQDGRCECRKYTENGKNKNGDTLSGLFLQHKTMKVRAVNVALRKSADQISSLTKKRDAAKAIDGNTKSYSCTKKNKFSWWRVDLGEIREIDHISLNAWVVNTVMYNRELLVETRRTGDDPWVLCKDLGDVKVSITEFRCDAKSTHAQFLQIRSTRSTYLRFYEVQVFGY